CGQGGGGQIADRRDGGVPKTYKVFLEPLGDDRVMMGEDLQSLIVFNRLNLMEQWPFHGLFDAIFCRNVMIYFDAGTKAALAQRFTQQIKPGGWLYIGHSRSPIGSHPGLHLVGRTVYRRDA